MKLTKKELLKSPSREWNNDSPLYDQVLLVQGGTKHESGYMHQVIIGATRDPKKRDNVTYEICGYPDDIEFQFSDTRYGERKEYAFGNVRMDCFYPQGVFQLHSAYGKFRVSCALSSMTIFLVPHAAKN